MLLDDYPAPEEMDKKGDTPMNMTEIKALAKNRGITCGKMNKTELIRTMQREEGNRECFNTAQANSCGQNKCLWIADCR